MRMGQCGARCAAADERPLEEALAIYRALAVRNPDVYRPNLAATLSNLGALNRDENRKAEARKGFEEALAIYREFAARGGDLPASCRTCRERSSRPRLVSP